MRPFRDAFEKISSFFLSPKKPKPFTILIVIFFFALISLFVYQRYFLGWVKWSDITGFADYIDASGGFHPAKTIWDWLELLIIPIVLAIGVAYFNYAEKNRELKVTDERNLEAVLQN